MSIPNFHQLNTPGVFNITDVNVTHDALKYVKKLKKEEQDEEEEEENIAVVQAFTCNAHVTPLFSKYGNLYNLLFVITCPRGRGATQGRGAPRPQGRGATTVLTNQRIVKSSMLLI